MNNPNTIVFEPLEKKLAVEMLTSSTDFTTEDVALFANSGIITLEDATELRNDFNNRILEPEKELHQTVLHKKALLVLAKDNMDPDLDTLINLKEQEKQIMNKFETKYGETARINQGQLIGKLINKISGKVGSVNALESCKKISSFQ